MGQKVNPHGLRVGVIKEWDSKWYAEKDFADYLVEDYKIREFVKKKLREAGISKTEIERKSDKIKVIDQENKEAAFSGIASQDSREKVMDLELKEEYKQGWFGNAKLSGGYRPGVNEEGLGDDRHALYGGNLMVSGYNEKDQLTLIANGQNASDPGGSGSSVFISVEDDLEMLDALSLLGGMKTTAMAGANLNSDRLKGMESSASVSYNFSDQISGTRTARESMLVGENPLFTNGLTSGTSRSNRVSVNFELNRKDTRKINFVFRPAFRFNSSASTSRNQSTTTDVLGEEINGTDAGKSSSSRSFQASGRISGGVRSPSRASHTLRASSYSASRR